MLAAFAVVPTLGVFVDLMDDLSFGRAAAGWALMYAVYLPLAWALSRALLPFSGATTPDSLPPMVDEHAGCSAARSRRRGSS